MQKIKPLLDLQKKRLEQGSSSSLTEAGRTEASRPDASASKAGNASDEEADMDHRDAIGKLFAEFQFAYHNQYHKAFPDEEALIIAKKFWLQSLGAYPVEVILQAGKELIRTQRYLPTIAAIIEACEKGTDLFGLPDVRRAYIEACMAPAPRIRFQWSHPAVYHAGKMSDWYLLANQSERVAFPIFEYHYTRLCRQVLQGQQLDVDAPKPLPEKTGQPIAKSELKKRIRELRKELNL